MATSFVDVYDLSINQFDSPAITKAYANSPISFFKIMYNYLNNAIPAFNNPLTIPRILADKLIPDGDIETFIGTGSLDTFALSSTPTTTAFFEYTMNGSIVDATFDFNTNSVTYQTNIPNGQEATCEWYEAGQFNQTLDDEALGVLSTWLTAKWAMKEKNFQLDIRRLINDNDFKLDSSSANSIRSKVLWYDEMREEAEKLMNQYAWNYKFKVQQGL